VLPTAPDLKYFLMVAETLNIRRAAERLRLAQPSLSMAIKRVEDALGSPLFIRGKSGVRLTRTAQRFVPKARMLLEEWERICTEAAKDEAELRGRYVVGCPSDLALMIIPVFLPKLMHDHSALEIELQYGFSPHICEDVVSCRIDFGIVASPVMHPDLIIRPICHDEIRLWVSANGGHPTQDIKSDQAVLVYNPGIMGLSRPVGPEGPIIFARTVKTANFHVVASLVKSGVGIGLLPGRIAAFYGKSEFRPLATEILHIPHEICLVYRVDMQRSSASRQFAHELEALLFEAMKSRSTP
jgi:DNA-binding transcriptional LysR family regulator